MNTLGRRIGAAWLIGLIGVISVEAADIQGPTIQWVPGETRVLTAEGKTEITYHVAVPPRFDPTKPRPLLILFSPGGKGERILGPAIPAAAKYNWMAVGVDRLKNGYMDTRLMMAMEDEVLEDIYRRVPHDPKRRYVGGLSGGAMRAFSLTVRRDDGWAGVLSIGGWLGGQQYANRKYPKGLAVAMVAGDKDKGAHQWAPHDAAVFNRLGGRVQMFVFPGGHEMAPSGILKQALRWFDRDWRDFH